MTTQELLIAAKAAAPTLAQTGTDRKNQALLAMAASLEAACDEILAANRLEPGGGPGTTSRR